ncbi:MAG: SH3 domain-containing protein [Aggregatilineales bacterium]
MAACRSLFLCALALAAAAAAPAAVQSQAAPSASCPALVQRALLEVGDNCDALGRNTACYGFVRVNATFQVEQPPGFFTDPADQAELSVLQSIQTVPLDTSRQEWGIAVLNVQANLPTSLPGQAVVFLLFGDVSLESAVSPADVYTSAEPVSATVLVSANLRSGPSTASSVLASAPAGTQVLADALSADAAWVRVLAGDLLGWISRDLVRPEAAGALAALPVVTARSRTPMQAFTFRTGARGLECSEAPPSVLVIQGPQNARVDITANGANIRIGSTIALFTTEDNLLQLVTLSDRAEVGGVVIPAGFTVFAPLSPDGAATVGDWTGFRPLTADELRALEPLEGIPANLLHYPLELPTLADIARTQAAIGRPPVLPADDQAQPGAATPTLPAGGYDCSGFALASPLDAAAVGEQAFYWYPAAGVDGYRWVLLDERATVLSIMDTTSPFFFAALSPRYGRAIQWEVQALKDGAVVCSTRRAVIPLIDAGVEPPPPTFNQRPDDDDDDDDD